MKPQSSAATFSRIVEIAQDLSDCLREEELGVPAFMTSATYLSQYFLLYKAVDRLHTSLAFGNRPQPVALDWGAGYGHFSAYLAKSGWECRAYTLADRAVSPYLDTLLRLSDNFGFPVSQGADPTVIEADDESVDMVVSVGVLEHVEEGGGDAVQSLREIARALRPRGKFVCAHLPSRFSIWEFANRRFGRPSHSRVYRYSEMRELLTAAGLRPESMARSGIVPRNLFAKAVEKRKDPPQSTLLSLAKCDEYLSMLAGPFAQNMLVVAVKE